MSFDRRMLFLLLAAVMVRGGVLLARGDRLQDDPDAYREVAEVLQTQGMFGATAQWRLLPPGFPPELLPTAHRPPLYPLVLAACGVKREHGAVTVGVLHLLLGVATVWLTLVLAQRWKLSSSATVLAAGLVMIDPILLNQSAQVMTETLAALLAVGTLVALSWKCPSLGRVLLAGGLTGLAALCRPTFLPLVVLVPGVLIWQLRSMPRRWRYTIAFAAAAMAVLAPWTIRNQRMFGAPIVGTTHGGFTLLLGNNPVFYEYLRTESWLRAWQGEPQMVWWLFRELAEDDRKHSPPGVDRSVAADRIYYDVAFDSIADDPGGFALACLYRMTSLWGLVPRQRSPDEGETTRVLRWLVGVFYLAVFALAIRGVWATGRGWVRQPWIWGLLLVTVSTAVHLYYWTDLRMRAPLVPVIAICAAAGWEHWRNSRTPASGTIGSPDHGTEQDG